MNLRIVAAIGLCSLLPVSSAFAGDKDFDKNTILMISTDSVSKMKSGWDASQAGAFMADPAISKLWDHLQKGVMTMMTDSMSKAQMSDEDRAQFNEFRGTIEEWCAALATEVTGRASLALGYRNDASGAMQPNLTVHFQAGDKVAAIQSKLIDLLVKSSDGQVARTSMDIQGVKFDGFAFPTEQAPPMIKLPDGLFFGRKGNDFYIGISKDGLSNFLSSANATGATAVGGRLGDEAHYQRSVGATGPADFRMFLNLEPLWQFVPMAVQMAAPSESQEILGALNGLGLSNFQGVYSTGNWNAAGSTSNSFLAIKERKGLFELLPSPGQSVEVPTFAPKSALGVQVGRLQLDKALDLFMRIAGQIGGEPARQEMSNGLAEVDQMLGIKVADLVSSLEGSLAWIELENQGGAAGMAIMNDPTAALGRLVLGLKLKDTGPFERLFSTLSSHPEFGGQFKVESFLDRKVYSIASDAPPEFGGSMPMPGFAIDKGWLVMGMKVDDLRDSLRAASGDASGQLASDPKFNGMASKLGGNGMWVMYQDTGKKLGGMSEMAKMLVTFAAMGLPEEVFNNKDLMYVLSPQNIPSSSVFEKYFGHQVSNMSVVEGGVLQKIWAPNTAKKPTSPKAAGR